MRRLFLGIALPGSYEELLTAAKCRWSGRLRSRLRWVRPESWHLTLVFFGSVVAHEEAVIVSALKQVQFTSFQLQGAGGGFFPVKGHPRVVWLGVSGDVDSLLDLKKNIDAALIDAGREEETRPFVPHLTLARVKDPAKDAWSAVAEDLGTVLWPVFEVDAFILWESVLHPEGARYRVRNMFYSMGVRGGQAPHGESQC